MDEELQDRLQGAYAVASELPAPQADLLVGAADQAFVEAMTTTVVVAGVVILAGAALALVGMPDRGRRMDDDPAAAMPGSTPGDDGSPGATGDGGTVRPSESTVVR